MNKFFKHFQAIKTIIRYYLNLYLNKLVKKSNRIFLFLLSFRYIIVMGVKIYFNLSDFDFRETIFSGQKV